MIHMETYYIIRSGVNSATGPLVFVTNQSYVNCIDKNKGHYRNSSI